MKDQTIGMSLSTETKTRIHAPSGIRTWGLSSSTSRPILSLSAHSRFV